MRKWAKFQAKAKKRFLSGGFGDHMVEQESSAVSWRLPDKSGELAYKKAPNTNVKNTILNTHSHNSI